MRRLLSACIFFGLAISAHAAHVNPGNCARLVDRPTLDIPAHPAPGDGRVPFRFARESIVSVVRLDAGTGWFEVRDAMGQVGWITHTYLDEEVECAGVTQLEWCPPIRSQHAHPSGRLRIATWNLGNLHRDNGGTIFNNSVARQDEDYERIRCYVRMFDPDILAVQEVDGEEALSRVVDGAVYEVHVSSRGNAIGRQNTGFAFKRGLNVVPQPDFDDLDTSPNGSLRHGTVIETIVNGITLKMMSVHMKSGCFQGNNSGSACNSFFNQVPVLDGWIDDAADDDEPFIVLGDFNRRFNLDNDEVWATLDDADHVNDDLTNITLNKPISCRDNEFVRFIDHIVFGLRAWEFVDDSSFRHMTYRQADEDVWDQISDHCPVIVDMWPG